MPFLSIVVPVYNERANVRSLVEKVSAALEHGPEWELVFVDDGSTDGSFEELVRISTCRDRVKVIRLRRNFGQSAAMQAGFDHATGSIIVTMDGDLQNDPADIPRLLAEIQRGADVALGQRVNRQDKLLVRKIPSWAANWLIRKITRVPFRDFGCTLRAMRREVVDGMALYGEMHRFITAFAVQQGAVVTQVPVTHHPRIAGKSKYNLSRTIRVLLDLMTVKFLASYQTRPMHLFGSLGVVMMLLGGASLIATLGMKWFQGIDMTGNPLLLLGVFLEVLSVQFISLGLLGEVMTRIYFESQGKPPYLVREKRGYEVLSTRIRSNDPILDRTRTINAESRS